MTYIGFGAGAFTLFKLSGFDAHITWAHSAAIGYAVAAVISLVPLPAGAHRPRLARVAALTGALVVPFAMLLNGHHQMQNEVEIISRSGSLLMTSGVPYVHDASALSDINPYLPVMAIFGMPAALMTRAGLDPGSMWNIVGDPRIWCAAIAIVGIWGSMRLLHAHSGRARHIAVLMIASPTVALEMCASGVDLPLAGFLVLGLALAATRHPVTGALCIAAAVAIKWVALLSLPIVLALLVTRYGWRVAARFGGVFLAASAVFMLPAILSISDTIAQVFEFPAGIGAVATPAQSPMPGVLLASLGTAGRLTDMVLLTVCGIVLAYVLVRRPPTTFSTAATFIGIGFTCFFLFAPVGRFGYLLIPMLLFGLAYIARRTEQPRRVTKAPSDTLVSAV
ncbi:hypothetical protein AAFP35_08070 [Gordonia sp. CPCC 206044]|uniref:hypothetical protein n=1 Tax=Gordonia sp. CPCC 206044 TaxID=3140793 RepID=UPI003AF3A11B